MLVHTPDVTLAMASTSYDTATLLEYCTNAVDVTATMASSERVALLPILITTAA